MAISLSFLKLIPLNLKEIISNTPVPAEIPEKFREVIEKPSNMYDFVIALGNFTNNLSSEQRNFKELISYLHQQKAVTKLYEQFGIKGYDGENITDRKLFIDSYQDYYQKGKEKDKYELFLDMYGGLEIFGFVKGKPKKQKLLNMINDGRHAFYGAFCNIVVSSDVDFIAKTNFLYDIHDVFTFVSSLEDFRNVLVKLNGYSKLKLSDLVSDVSELPEDRLIEQTENSLTYRLKSLYYGYFNIVKIVYTEHGNYWYISGENKNFLNGTLPNEFEYVTGRLISELGLDIQGKGAFDRSEIQTGDWDGRRWHSEKTVIELGSDGKLYVAFFPFEYLQKLQLSNLPENDKKGL